MAAGGYVSLAVQFSDGVTSGFDIRQNARRLQFVNDHYAAEAPVD